ncbi:MAG: tyrosine-type recombinase/integrase [Balneolales bacterium]
MPLKHLTDTFIRGLQVETRTEFYDTDHIVNGKVKSYGSKGLGLRVSPAGRKVFIYRYRFNDSSRRMNLGIYPSLKLSDARGKVSNLSDSVAEGDDPARQLQEKKTDIPVTLAEYCDTFEVNYMQTRLKASTLATELSRLNKIKSSPVAKMYIKDVTRADIRRFLQSEAKQHPINANRLHSLLSKLFNEALDDEKVVKNPIKGMKKIGKENTRTPEYTHDDIQAIWKATETLNISMRGLVRMLLITGQRRGEVAQMRWKELDGDVWTIPKAKTKTDRTHKVYLFGMAQRVLQDMKRINGESEYVFASISNPDKVFHYFGTPAKKIREKAELPDFHVHDLRHIVVSEMAKLKIPQNIAGKCVNHAGLAGEHGITSRYNQYDYNEEIRDAFHRWNNLLTELVIPMALIKSKVEGA